MKDRWAAHTHIYAALSKTFNLEAEKVKMRLGIPITLDLRAEVELVDLSL